MKHPDLISNDKVLPFLERARGGKYYDTGKLGHVAIDEFLRFKDGEFVVVTGHANVGKTHTLIYLMLMQTMNYDKKWLVYSSENEVHSLKRKLIEFLSCETIQNITEAKMYRHLDYDLTCEQRVWYHRSNHPMRGHDLGTSHQTALLIEQQLYLIWASLA